MSENRRFKDSVLKKKGTLPVHIFEDLECPTNSEEVEVAVH